MVVKVAGKRGDVAVHIEHEAGDVCTSVLASSGDAGEGDEVGSLEGVIAAGGHGGRSRGRSDGIGGRGGC